MHWLELSKVHRAVVHSLNTQLEWIYWMGLDTILGHYTRLLHLVTQMGYSGWATPRFGPGTIVC